MVALGRKRAPIDFLLNEPRCINFRAYGEYLSLAEGIRDDCAVSRPLWSLAYFRSEDQGKLTKFSRLSKQILPYILR